MWRSAVVRFGVLASIAGIACGGGSRSGGDTTLSNRGADGEGGGDRGDRAAAYWCSISSGGYDYPAMPCVMKHVNGQLMLAKLAGSQRFRGVVRPRTSGDDGFAFDGELYCPWGDCTKPLHGVFEPTADGKLRGTFDDRTFVVTMTRATDANGFGGVGYGGDSYGGFGYGGTQPAQSLAD